MVVTVESESGMEMEDNDNDDLSDNDNDALSTENPVRNGGILEPASLFFVPVLICMLYVVYTTM